MITLPAIKIPSTKTGAIMDEEQYLLEQISAIQREYQKAIEPYTKRLALIYACKPPAPLIMPADEFERLSESIKEQLRNGML
jgi:hypothetical protein